MSGPSVLERDLSQGQWRFVSYRATAENGTWLLELEGRSYVPVQLTLVVNAAQDYPNGHHAGMQLKFGIGAQVDVALAP